MRPFRRSRRNARIHQRLGRPIWRTSTLLCRRELPRFGVLPPFGASFSVYPAYGDACHRHEGHEAREIAAFGPFWCALNGRVLRFAIAPGQEVDVPLRSLLQAYPN
ncbi:uncharacterized protein SCHCODRAFT_02283045 [Schizophyllum commune H4-8]|uniref:uncharacterized protein n=1 Tax=Schizophyllum commune (strain H4-8 / FGSC 9210) TaxID=578458 RepID=UPI002160BD0E|nr:uncharacterized protein SCHCODRAFT_02283045 [Schizophyllum commune H4-8]KAI5892088.1 hypothetical protein SCHCODRAFT_02283045 [Schizophyllum commune H4-8]